MKIAFGCDPNAKGFNLELAKCLVKEFLSLSFDPASRSGQKVERIVAYEREDK